MEIINYSVLLDACRGNHADIFPKDIHCAIVGSAGSGKTNLLSNLLRKENCL